VPKFSPCAASRLVAQSQIDSLIANGLEVISCGANVPLLIKKSFGPIMEDVDHKVSFVVWRVYLLTSWRKSTNDRRSHFSRYLRNYKKAILKAYALNNSKTNISATAFEIALKQLV
jgi:hypothetical protein